MFQKHQRVLTLFLFWGAKLCQEFKLNANAKSFTPNFTPLRPPSPVLQGPVYVPGMIPPVSPIQTMPAGVNPLLQTAARYPPYSPGAPPYIPSPTVYTPVSGAPVIVGGQTSMKVLPQLQQPVSFINCHSFIDICQ